MSNNNEEKRKWGRVGDIDYRTKVGSDAWFDAHPENIQHLSAHRRLHMLADHEEVRHLTDASVEDKIEEIVYFEREDDAWQF